jgi:hypothetical protein
MTVPFQDRLTCEAIEKMYKIPNEGKVFWRGNHGIIFGPYNSEYDESNFGSFASQSNWIHLHLNPGEIIIVRTILIKSSGRRKTR